MKKSTPLLFMIFGALVGALGYWRIDFSEDGALYQTVFYTLAPGAFLVTLISGFIRKNKPAMNALIISLGVMLGMLSRIAVDLIKDPSSHNLFPFELMIGLVIVLPAAFLGAYLAYGIFYLAGKN
jgi:FtsH-binding integral membrane protein